MIAFKVLIGLLIILPGACVLLAAKNEKFKVFLEENLLDKKFDLFAEEHKYSTIVKWSGWHNIVVGFLIALPFPSYFYPGLLIGVGVGIYLYSQCMKITNVVKVDDQISDKAVEGEVVDTSAGDNK